MPPTPPESLMNFPDRRVRRLAGQPVTSDSVSDFGICEEDAAVMNNPLRILIIEDSEDDSLLLVRELTQGGYSPDYRIVDTADSMRAALAGQGWDAITSDYNMPRFSALAALKILQESDFDIPF